MWNLTAVKPERRDEILLGKKGSCEMVRDVQISWSFMRCFHHCIKPMFKHEFEKSDVAWIWRKAWSKWNYNYNFSNNLYVDIVGWRFRNHKMIKIAKSRIQYTDSFQGLRFLKQALKYSQCGYYCYVTNNEIRWFVQNSVDKVGSMHDLLPLIRAYQRFTWTHQRFLTA